jgi:hypothetical protein
LAAHNLVDSDPVWLMLVAPPGSMKTELLHSLKDIVGVHLIDEITPHTFISGLINQKPKPGKPPASLLHRIGKSGIIAFADFSTVLEMDPKARGSILAQMRRIYDGHFRREMGHSDTDGKPEWEGRITFLVGVTPVIDQHYGVFQQLGERFILVRMSRPEMEAALIAIKQVRGDVKNDLKAAVNRLMSGAGGQGVAISPVIEHKLVSLAEFVVRARTHVPRSGYTKEMLYQPEAEAPTRLAVQLAQLSRGSAALEARSTVSMLDYQLTVRAGMDSIPAIRRKAIESLRKGELPELPRSTRKYVLEDLEALGLVVLKLDGMTQKVTEATLSATAEKLIQEFSVH